MKASLSSKWRLLTEVATSGLLAFVLVTVIFSTTSPAPMSLSYLMSLA